MSIKRFYLCLFFILILSICSVSQIASAAETWIGTWASGQQLVESQNNPASPYLANDTLRQIVHATLGGSRIRVQFSNKYSSGSTTINSVHIALSNSGIPVNSSIDTGTDTALTFSGLPSVTISAGEEIYSDAVDFNVPPLSDLVVSIYFGSASSTSVTGHPGSRTSYYLKTGNTVSDAETESGYKAEHWYILSRIEVLRDDSYGCVVALGDSITDGRGCDPNYNNRWPDLFAARLNANPTTTKVGVINQGIGGNAVVSGGIGPTATARFDHDVTGQPGAKWVIVFAGTNDINGGASSSSLISAYQEFITKAHNAGLLIYGATITPFRGSSYYSTSHEAVRDAVNDWIRTSGEFDGVVDFDAAVWDPADHDYLNPAYRVYPPGDQNDFLHFNAAGFQAMANAIDLALFEEQKGPDTVVGNMMLINDNGGWCWYQDDKIVYDPDGGNILTSTAAQGTGFGGVSGTRLNDMDATTFNIATGKRTRVVAREGGGGDDHNMGAFWVRPDGRYLHMYCMHYNDQDTFYRVSTNPHDGSSWGSEQSYNWEAISGYTDDRTSSYTNVYHLSGEGGVNGRLYNIIRVFERTPCISYSDDNGSTWNYMGRLNNPVGGDTYSNFYHKFRSNGVDRIDFIGCEKHPRDYTNSVYHGYIQGGKSYNSFGVEMDTINDNDAPTIEAFTPVWLTGSVAAGEYHTGWTNEIELDKDGFPVCLFQTRYGTDPYGGDPGAADHRFFYGRFDGSSWNLTELAKMGTGLHTPEEDYLGMGCIHPDDVNLIYISTPFDPRDDSSLAHHEIFKGVTYDKGATWNWTQITINSTEDNIRPAIPPWDANNTAVFWTRGEYPGQEVFDFVLVGMVEEKDMTLGLVNYIDASPSNTEESGGSPFTPTGPSGSAGSADSEWHEYTGYGNGGSCYTAGDGGTENAPTIVTTISGLSDGLYDVFAYFWCDPDLSWGIRGGFTSSDMLCFSKQSSQHAEASRFSGSVDVVNGDYILYRVYIGRKEISGGGSIDVYIDNYDNSYSGDVPSRTTYDGVGVASVSYVEDVIPPMPDPMTWASVPAATGSSTITMTATTATDDSPPVQYYFECTNDGSKSSGWQTSTTYVASGLDAGTSYSFRVMARDSAAAMNETGWSTTESATTNAPDTTPPTPDPMTWSALPTATGETTITMTATTATDADSPPVEYYFECTNDGSKTSGWQSSSTYLASGLTPDTLYSFRVMARDSASALNETGWSSTESATTDPPDTTPPIPDPMTWATVPMATGAYTITMTATTATDTDSPPVEYYFECTNDGSKTSGWQSSSTYIASGLTPSTLYSFRVMARDSSAALNETGWSSAESATTEEAPIDVEILGSWTTGTSHTKESGISRALVFIAHGEMDGTMNLTAVTYGGQAMTKVVDRNYTATIEAYAAAYILDEAGVAAATNGTFTPTWTTTPTEVKYASVFLQNVNQTTLIGESDSGGGTSNPVTTPALATNEGDMVITAATCGNTGTYTLNNGFTQGSHQSSESSTGVTGHKSATGASETPSATHTSVNRQTIIGFVVQGGTPPDTNTATNPYPGDGASNISVTTSLYWDAPTAYTPTSYDVYFGIDPDAHNNPKHTVYTESYDPTGDLLESTTYCWAVDSSDAGTIYPGDDWSFTTYVPITIGDLVADYIVSQSLTTYYAWVCSYYGVLVYSEVTEDTGLKDDVIAAFPSTYYTGATLPPEGSVDENVYGILPFELYRQTGDANYLTSALYLADAEFENPRPDGLSEYTRFWIDDTYMIGSLQAQAYKSMEDINYANNATTQLLGYMGEVEQLQQSNGLFHHTLNAPYFWGRGNGWAAAAMTEVLLAIPGDHPDRAQLLTKYQDMMDGLLTYQDPNGMWYQLLDMGSDPDNWVESSCTGMFVFAMATGVKEGWLPESPYLQAALDGWVALENFVDGQGRVLQVCTGTGEGTNTQYYFDRPHNEVGNPHGQAAVIWAAKAIELLSGDITPPVAPTGLSAAAGDDTVSLDWDDNNEPDLDGYNVYRSTTSGSGYSQINGSLLSSSDYTDNSVSNGITYYYVVTAIDTNSNESGYSNEDFATPTGPPDTTPPTPDPMTWATLPTATGQTTITMTATTATDADSPPVEYYFECTNDGSKTSGWQSSSAYLASGLTPDTLYSFRVMARDSAPALNETGWSSTESATTDPPDTTPPTPDPMTWATSPTATGSSTITMTATTATDVDSPPVEYYFECTNDGTKTSGWQSGTTYVASGLTPSTLYSFRVMARDSSAALNETGWSSTESATTEEPPNDIEILGSWATGTSHTKESGSDRALIFIAHGESTDAMNLSSVTYGGQSMSKIVDFDYEAASGHAYAAAFILKEAGVAAASGGTFSPTWGGTAPGNAGYASVFLSNVNQTDPNGASDSGGSTSNPVTTSALATSSGDMVILAATCGQSGSYTLNNSFVEDTDQQIGGTVTGATGHKLATGANETPSATYSDSINRQMIIGFVVQAASGGGPVTRTLTASSTAGGSVTTPGEGSFDYADGTNASIVASANVNYHFVNWTGSAVTAGKVANPTSASTTVTMDGDYTVVANFAIDQRTLTSSSTAGGDVTTPGEGAFDYDHGAAASIVATANANYHFVNWTGTAVTAGKVASPTSASTTVTMDGDYTVVANFAIDQRTLTSSSTAGGDVTTPGEGAFDYDHGTVTSIAATANTNYHFVEWTGTAVTAGKVASPTSASTTVTMDGDYTVVANFAIDQRTLTSSSTAGGDVTTPGEGTFDYDHGAAASIVATANTNYHFVEWTGTAVAAGKVASPTSASTTVTMDGNYTVVANFEIDQRTLTSFSTAGGNVTTPGEGTFDYDHGTDAGIVASADPNYHFVEWTGTAVAAGKVVSPTSASTTVTMDGDYTVVANFAEDTVIWTLSSSSTANGSVTTPGEGDFDYDEGTYASIVATADLNYHFLVWTGTAVTAGKVADPCAAGTTVLMDASYTVVANFAIDQRTLTSSSTAGGSVTTPGEGAFDYDHGTAASIVAAADVNYHFVEWTGTAVTAGKVASPTSASTTVTMDGDYTVVANFAIDQRTLTSSSTAGGSVTTPGEGAFDYDHDTYANIVATAEAEYHFVEWTGSAVIAGKVADPCVSSTTVLMDSDYTVIANFEADPVDTTPPTPDPMTWASVPAATGSTTITMTATTATDIESPPVEYYFECTSDGSKSSTWQTGTTYIASGLVPSTLYSFRVRARDSASTPNETGWSSTESVTTDIGTGQTPYPGPDLHAIPGRVEAENYDDDGEGIAYHDLTSGNEGGDYRSDDVDVEACSEGNYNIGWLESGEWLEYSVIVETTGTYDIEARVGANGAGGGFHLEFDGNDVTGTVSVPDTGAWQTYTSIFINDVDLTAGAHIMRLSIDSSWWNLTWLDFNLTVDTTPPAPPTGLSATAGNEVVWLDWNDNNEPDLDGYNVYRSTIQGSDYNQINTMRVTSSDYVDNDVNNGITYYYVVTAVDTNDNESDDSNEDSATPDFQDCADIQIGGYGFASDLDGDCYVDYWDLEIVADYWLRTDCAGPDNCEGADFEPTDGIVDLFDFGDFAEQWLLCNDPEDSNCTPNW